MNTNIDFHIYALFNKELSNQQFFYRSKFKPFASVKLDATANFKNASLNVQFQAKLLM